MSVANVDEAFSRVIEHWAPRVIAQVYDSYVVTDRTKSIEQQL